VSLQDPLTIPLDAIYSLLVTTDAEKQDHREHEAPAADCGGSARARDAINPVYPINESRNCRWGQRGKHNGLCDVNHNLSLCQIISQLKVGGLIREHLVIEEQTDEQKTGGQSY
jgi:hypothetical protein